MRTLLAALFVLTISPQLLGQTIQVIVGKKKIIGKPIFWNDYVVNVIERDSKISQFEAKDTKDYKVLSKSFRFYSQSQLRARLQQEFGSSFDVSGTGQYLVVHPAGQRDRWANRFEELYRSMVRYYSVRGISARRMRFPFIAVVFPSFSMYAKYAKKVNDYDAAGSLGFYSQETNRIYLHDVTNGQADDKNWYINAETIIHEAAHQTAFNIGVHRRYGAAPKWVVEGIGTLFEARGVWNGDGFPAFDDRINRNQLAVFRKYINQKNVHEYVKNIVASDLLFNRSTENAYALSWAITFYANETQPRQYGDLVKRMYGRKSFHPYSATSRLNDFRNSFGDIQKFAVQMMSYYDRELPSAAGAMRK